MSIINNEHFAAEETPDAAGLNFPHTEVQSGSITNKNTAAAWCSKDHLAAVSSNALYQDAFDGTTVVNYSNTTWVTLQNSTMREINLNYFPSKNEILRVHGSGMVAILDGAADDETGITDYGAIVGDEGKSNYYAFRILLTYSDAGAPNVTEAVAIAGYSFTEATRVRYSPSGIPAAHGIQWQCFAFSNIVHYPSAPGIREYKKVELQVRLFDGSNILGIERNQIQAIRAKR